MDRVILFRGKTKSGGLYYGDLRHDEDGHCYILGRKDFSVEVIPETVSQYTNLDDKTGKRIFEGDIIRAGEHEKSWSGKSFGHLLLVEWNGIGWTHKVLDQYGDAQPTDYFSPNVWSKYGEVVGNKWNNPELIKD